MMRAIFPLGRQAKALLGLAVLVWLTAALPASAHWADLAVAELKVEGRVGTLTLTIPTGLVRFADEDRDGKLSEAEIRQHAVALNQKLGAAIRLTAGGEPGRTTVAPSDAGPTGEELAGGLGGKDPHSTLALRYSWEPVVVAEGEAHDEEKPHTHGPAKPLPPLTAVTMRYDLFEPGVSTAKCLATVFVAGKVQNVIFTPDSREFLAGEATPWWRQAVTFVHSGIEHILFGFDHVLFLISLLMLGGGLWYVVKVVTAFTVAHSITLTLAVLGLVNLPGRWVESAIALTIVYVAAENFWRKNLDGRWIITFAFGLIHGFGFAGALAGTGLPKENLALSLASFNVGVELGQVLVVVVAYGLFSLARGRSFERPLRLTVSAAVIAMGLFWFVERAFLA